MEPLDGRTGDRRFEVFLNGRTEDGRTDGPAKEDSRSTSAFHGDVRPRTSTVWGDGAVLIISKNLPLKGKFFEMVRYPCLAPQGGSGGLRPLRNLRYPCLAPAARRTDGEKSKNEPQGSYRPKNLTI